MRYCEEFIRRGLLAPLKIVRFSWRPSRSNQADNVADCQVSHARKACAHMSPICCTADKVGGVIDHLGRK